MSIASPCVTSDETPDLHDPLNGVLRRVRAEVARVADLVEGFEPHLTDIAGGTAPGSQAVRALQDIDLAVQKLRGLADFLDQLQAAVPADCLVDTVAAVNVLKLSDMQARLAQRPHGRDVTRAPHVAHRAVGDVDLF